jgi:hypothetical protein
MPMIGNTVSFTRTPSDYAYKYGTVISACKETQKFGVRIPGRETPLLFHCACSWDDTGHFQREMFFV